ncbi:MAG: RluA family pseudouridine synthase [Candidatus Andersenbacteria bacterium]|nr:RluA family pseudouridine synthase [Candidatus Andersenbacteria bacterium]
MVQAHIIKEQQAGQRLDVFCTGILTGMSRSAIQRLIKEQQILINGLETRAKVILKAGDKVEFSLPEAQEPVEEERKDIRLHVLYEDRDVVVVDKPAGIAVHHGVGLTAGTVADWFAEHYPEAKNVGEKEGRAGIIHRLDKDTSGVLILAKNDQALEKLKKQFYERKAKKEYIALVFEVPGGKEGRITKSIGRSRRNPMRRAVDENGKESATEWKIERRFGEKFALLRVFPFTGRTHQIRVHLHHLGYPIVGDHLYTFKRQKPPIGVKRQLLHAEKLTIMLPNEKIKTFVAPLADDFAQVVNMLSEMKWPKKVIKQ